MNIKQAFLHTSATGYLNAAESLAIFGLGATVVTTLILIFEKTLPWYYPYYPSLMLLVGMVAVFFIVLSVIRMGMVDEERTNDNQRNTE